MKHARPRSCIQCGAVEPVAMRHVDAHLIELNHVVGRANDPKLTVSMCLNCHARYSAMQRIANVDLEWYPERNVLDWIADCALQIGEFLKDIGELLTYWARLLRGTVAALDDAYPFWRDLPQVQFKPGTSS